MKSRNIVSLVAVGLALSLTGCFGGDKGPISDASPALIELKISETKKNVNDELQKLSLTDDMKTNKALIIGDDLLLVTYAPESCVEPPNSALLKDGNTLLVEIPEAKPPIACKGKAEPQGWDIEVPEKKASEIKSAQLTFSSGLSGGISVYVLDDKPVDSKETSTLEKTS